MSNLLKQLTEHAAEIHKTAEMSKTAEELFAEAVIDELQKLGYDEMDKEAVLKGLLSAGGSLLRKIPGVKKLMPAVKGVVKKPTFAEATAKNVSRGAAGKSRALSDLRQGVNEGKKILKEKAKVVKADPFLRAQG